MTSRFFNLVAGTLLCITVGVSTNAFAAKIKSAKGKKVLVDLEGDTAEPGQIYTVVKNGKATGLIKISKVRNNQALAVLGKGKAEPGSTIRLRQKKSARSSSARASAPSANDPVGTSYWGGMIGFNMASADVKLPISGRNVKLSGSGFSIKGLFDYKILESIWFRGFGGLEQFVIGGDTDAVNCQGGECKAEINYISFDGWARYVMSTGTFRPWLGAGASLMFPMSKEATALQSKSITNTNLFAFGGGFDWFISPTTYIPLQIDYNLYPSSSTVKASTIAFRAGFSLPW